MIRWINISLLALVGLAATWTYQIKHEAEVKLGEIRDLERQIALEKETIELLNADWAFLSHPARLQALIERYEEELGLQVTDSNQVIDVNELPDKPIFDEGKSLEDIIAGDTIDNMTTSAVGGEEGN